MNHHRRRIGEPQLQLFCVFCLNGAIDSSPPTQILHCSGLFNLHPYPTLSTVAIVNTVHTVPRPTYSIYKLYIIHSEHNLLLLFALLVRC